MSHPPVRIDEIPTFDTLERLAEWLITTCLLFGASLDTALIVAWHFAHDPKIKAAYA